MGWLFDVRATFVRMLLLDLIGIGYLVFGTEVGREPTGRQWILAVVAFTATLLLHKRQVANLLVQSSLLVAAFVLVQDRTINQVGASSALFELTMAASRSLLFWNGACLILALCVVAEYASRPDRWIDPVIDAAVVVGVPVLLGLVIRTTQELERQAEAKVAAERQQREWESRAARADERSAIARELHDVVAHHVASMVLRLSIARHVLSDAEPRVVEVFDDVHHTGAAALAELRKLLEVLRDSSTRTDPALAVIVPAALPAALAAAVSTAEQAGLTVECAIDDGAAAIDAVCGLAVLRLTQEALTNAAKHAGPAAHARLRVTVADGDVIWSVEDDGGGVAPGLPSKGGHGLTGMRARVEVLGGALTAGPSDKGWRVATVLPSTGPTPSSVDVAIPADPD